MAADIKQLESIASQVRRDIVRMVHGAASGHPGGSLGCTDFLVALYFHQMQINEQFHMDGKGEDLFFLSNGHISPVWYSVLSRRGFFPKSELGTFRKINSMLQGHPATLEHTPGVRVASGSLGQGMSVACGAALTKKLNKENTLVYSLHGDGEMQEGQNWEAMLFAAQNKIDNLIVTVDLNGVQIDGTTDEVMGLGNMENKFKEFGFITLTTNGNNMAELVATLEAAKKETGKGKPVAIMMKTVMGQGVDFMMTGHHWHGIAPNDEQLADALSQLEETLGDY